MIAYCRLARRGFLHIVLFPEYNTRQGTGMLDFLLHIDQNLTYLITNFGHGAYIILFLIILLETGCIITVFMPGDSLLFVTGAGAASTTGPNSDSSPRPRCLGLSILWLLIATLLQGRPVAFHTLALYLISNSPQNENRE